MSIYKPLKPVDIKKTRKLCEVQKPLTMEHREIQNSSRIHGTLRVLADP